MADTLRHSVPPTDHLGHQRASQPERSEDGTNFLLNPFVGWSIALLVSLLLWWGLWLAVSSLIPALV